MSTSFRRLAFHLAAVLLCLGTGMGTAHADGPHIALHATQGPYEVTLFSAPDPLVTGPVELTALVQDAQTGVLLPAATLTGLLSLPARASTAAVSLRLDLSSRAASGSRLPGQTLTVSTPGDYDLLLRVSAPGRHPVVLHGDLPVITNRGRRNTVLWAVFAVLAMVVLFLANQKARQTMARHQARSR